MYILLLTTLTRPKPT